MKKILSIILLNLVALGASAQEKGHFEIYDFDTFKLHVYYTNDAPNDASYIIEGENSLVTMEQPYTHWAPAKAHMSHLQLSSRSAVDAEITESEKAMKSGATLFIGGHGGAAKRDALQFKITYLKNLKELLANNKSPESFITAMKKAYPQLLGEDGLEQLAQVMYK